jgi:thioredoxin-like negative regulator of GroEL
LLALVPESADDGYNYAMILFAMERYEMAEQVLLNYEYALMDNNDVLLLYARTLKELNKPEAVDSYAAWLANNNDAMVRYEYAQLLESLEWYALALVEYRAAHSGLSSGSTAPSRPEVRFNIARLLLIADAESTEGASELRTAVNDGFNNFDEIEKLLADDRISAENRDTIHTIVIEGRRIADGVTESVAEDVTFGIPD